MMELHTRVILAASALFLLLNGGVFQANSGDVTSGFFNKHHQEREFVMKETALVKGISTENQEAPLYHKIFEEADVTLGESAQEVREIGDSLIEEGMYNGSYYFDYGTYTYFVDPESDEVNAIAIKAHEMNDTDWELFTSELAYTKVFSGENKMDNMWMDIYETSGGDIVIERSEENGEPEFVWLTVNGLFQ
ncbi:hypothetical protein [Alteribacter keqinensis]|uniref:Uncharacterized protein n=1 Tax=Alteribacter keqinensis TaxID=2483800 RepID=A0A3M7TX17_9BACI|nr:hypothetical protein [Alteribacter keqinensis]RNA69819.1 hypothetical protein EBO34_07760 [Alteribacter keqinensis]